MATITPTIDDSRPGVKIIKWTAITHADQGESVAVEPIFSDVTVFIVATYTGSATFALQGSPDDSNWVTLHSAGGTKSSGTALSYSSNSPASDVVAQKLRYYRILRGSGSSGATATIWLTCVQAVKA